MCKDNLSLDNITDLNYQFLRKVRLENAPTKDELKRDKITQKFLCILSTGSSWICGLAWL